MSPLHYGKDCACRLVNQGDLPPGRMVWIRTRYDPEADFCFREPSFLHWKRQNPREASIYLSPPSLDAIGFYPSGHSRIRVARKKP